MLNYNYTRQQSLGISAKIYAAGAPVLTSLPQDTMLGLEAVTADQLDQLVVGHLLLSLFLQAKILSVFEEIGFFKFFSRVYFFFCAINIGVEIVCQSQVYSLSMVLMAMGLMLCLVCTFSNEVLLLRPFCLRRLILANMCLLFMANRLQVLGFLHKELYS